MAINKIRQAGNRVIPTLKDKVGFGDIINDTVTGGTQVPLSAEQGKLLRSDLNVEISDRAQAIIDLKGGVSISNSTLKKIEDNLNQEISDREDAIDQEVIDRDAAVLVEKTRALAAEVVLQNNITELANNGGDALDSEITRATTEEARIEAKLDAEIAVTDSEIAQLNGDSSVSGSVSQKVKVESDRAIAAEGVLQTNISNEASSRTAADTTLQSNIDTLSNTVATNKSTIEAALNAEASVRANADTAQQDRLTAIETTLAAGVSWKGSVADMAGLDSLEESSLVAGQAYYVTAEKDVYVVLSGVDGDYKPAGFENKSFLKIADFTELSGLVTAEKNRAVAAEASINAALSAEVINRTNADDLLQTNLNNEASTRAANDVTLQNNIDAEATARTSAVSTEEAARIAADTVLDGKIVVINSDKTVVGSIAYAVEQEAVRAKAAEVVNANAITAEVANRQADVDAEESRALTAEGVLDDKIEAEILARSNANSGEAATRLAADEALSGRLDVIEGDNTTVGSVAKAELDAKIYFDKWAPQSKLEGKNGGLLVVGDTITVTYSPMVDGVINGEVIVYHVDQDGTNEAVAVNVLSVSGSTITLDVVTAGEFDGDTCKVHYFFREGDQVGAGMGVAGENGAGE